MTSEIKVIIFVRYLVVFILMMSTNPIVALCIVLLMALDSVQDDMEKDKRT